MQSLDTIQGYQTDGGEYTVQNKVCLKSMEESLKEQMNLKAEDRKESTRTNESLEH